MITYAFSYQLLERHDLCINMIHDVNRFYDFIVCDWQDCVQRSTPVEQREG